MVVLLRLAACNTPLLIGLTTACFRHRRRPSCAPRASSRFAAFDCALRVLGTSALRAFTFLQAFASTVRNRRSASLASSLAALVAHWAHFGLFRSSIRNSRLATLPLASLLCSLDFRFACFAHCARRSSVPQGARFVRPSRALPWGFFDSLKRRFVARCCNTMKTISQTRP